jgi:hypothetical protein
MDDNITRITVARTQKLQKDIYISGPPSIENRGKYCACSSGSATIMKQLPVSVTHEDCKWTENGTDYYNPYWYSGTRIG